jgi:hypothetical protein
MHHSELLIPSQLKQNTDYTTSPDVSIRNISIWQLQNIWQAIGIIAS